MNTVDKRLIGTAIGVFLCATGAVLGQIHQRSYRVAGVYIPHVVGRPEDLYTPHLWGSYIPPQPPSFQAATMRIYRLDMVAAKALDAGQYAEAEDDARQSISLGPDSGMAPEILASALNAQGKTQEALEAYRQMADQGTDEPRNLLPYALLLLKTGQWARAVEAYNKQLPGLGDEFLGGRAALMSTYGPFSLDTPRPRELATAIHIGLGITYAAASWGKHSQDDKALHEYEQAVALEPNSGLTHLFYGHKLRKLGRRAEAQATFRKAAALGHGDVRTAAEEALR